MLKLFVHASAVALALAANPADAADPKGQDTAVQDKDANMQLTLQRVFGSPDLSGAAPVGVQLSPDGELLTFLRARPDDSDRYDLWATDIATGGERMLVDSKKVGTGAELSEQEKMQRERQRIGGRSGIVSYEWSPDGKSILVPLDGDLYLAGLDGSVRRLTATEAAELNPAVSPDGSYISFVRDNNLFAGKIGGAEPRQITDGKGDPISWGTAEFVAQEEMDRDTGYWWAPDDSRIAVQRTDETPVGIFTRAAIGADGTKVYEQRYPAAGKANALVSLYVMDPDGGNRVQVNMGPNPDIYLARVNWSQDGKTLYVQRESRDQKTLDLLQVDPATGKSSVLFTEKTTKPDSWLNLSHNFRSLKDGSLLWWSERSGHGHLYHYQAGQWTQLTKGDWEVEKVVGIDEARDRIYFSGNQDKPLEKQLYYTRISKPGDIVQLTENGWTNSASMDDSASRFRHIALEYRASAAILCRGHRRQAAAVDRAERYRRRPSLCALSRKPQQDRVRNDPGRRRDRTALLHDYPRSSAGQKIPSMDAALRRAGRAERDQQLERRATAIYRRSGLYLLRARQSRHDRAG